MLGAMRAPGPTSAATSLFEHERAHGLVVGVRAGELDEDGALMEEERLLARDFTESRRRLFVAGRRAMRRALELRGLSTGPVLASLRGAPVVHTEVGVSISISHKEHVAVALVGEPGTAHRVGVDVEIDRPLRFDIARRVLTDLELERLSALPEDRRSGFVLRRFSTKEAIYKAIDPFVQRYVAFREVSVIECERGFRVDLHLEPPFGLSVEVQQTELAIEGVGNVIVSTARAASRQ